MAADAAGNVYVADEGNHRVRKIDASATISTLAGREESGIVGDDGPFRADSINFHSPRAAALDRVGNLLFVDGTRLWKLNGGSVWIVASDASWSNYPPRGVAADAAGNVYVADQAHRSLRKIDAVGTLTTVAGFGSPQSVAGDALGNVYVVDAGRVQKIAGSGTVTALTGDSETGYGGDGGPAAEARLYLPGAMAADAAGNVFVVEGEASDGSRLRKIDTAGTITTVARLPIHHITALAADPSGNVFVGSEISGGQVWKVAAGDGEIELIAGTGEPGFEGDGSEAGSARLWVSGIAVGSSGNVWFTDHRNRRVRVLEPLRGGAVP